MWRKLVYPLPDWAQPDHPVLRYILHRFQMRDPRGWRIFRIILQVIAIALLVVLGYQIATDFGAQSARSIHDVLYWPLVFLGVVVGLAAMTLTSNVISLEKTRQTWDSLRLTSHGAGLVFHAQWLSAFYSLRGPLLVLFLARVIFALAILIDLAQYYRGRYLELLLSGIQPALPTFIGAALLAATMTVGLLQPVVAVGMDAAVGLLVAVKVRQPRYNILVRVGIGIVRLGVAVFGIVVGSPVFEATVDVSTAEGWARVLLHSFVGDQSLRLLSLEENGLLWVDLPYSVFLGLVLLGLTLCQAWIAGLVVNWAARAAERAE